MEARAEGRTSSSRRALEGAHDSSTRGPAPTDERSTTAPPGVWPGAGGAPDGTLTHVVKHLALGGTVLLSDGVSHCIRAHEQRVPVMRADRQRQNRRSDRS